jgi:rhodanese-related sulfurtransferase
MNKSLAFPIILILTSALISGTVYNLVSDNPLAFIYKTLELRPGTNLSHAETYRLLREGQVRFIDARYEEEFKTSRIPGAVNVPSNLSRDAWMALLKPIPKNTPIVVYCGSSSCQSARRLAGFMTYLGYKNISLYLAGFEEWLRLGYPVESNLIKKNEGS